MINPNKRYEVTGKVVAIETMTSMTVFKVETKHGTFDYTVFGPVDSSLEVGAKLQAVIGYSITLNNYTIKYLNSSLKAA